MSHYKTLIESIWKCNIIDFGREHPINWSPQHIWGLTYFIRLDVKRETKISKIKRERSPFRFRKHNQTSLEIVHGWSSAHILGGKCCDLQKWKRRKLLLRNTWPLACLLTPHIKGMHSWVSIETMLCYHRDQT